MLRKSKFRMSRKSSQKSKPNIVIDLPIQSEIILLKLSPKTQSFVKCRIGEEIYSENNWILIPKNAILASIEFSNDFLPAIDYVKDYPESHMLIGSYGFDQSISEEFELCTTVTAKQNTLTLLEDRKNKIKQIFNMPVFEWKSLGSEEEVIGMQNLNSRSLLVVEIDTIFPIFKGKRIFSIKEANNSVYVECFTNRYEYKNVWKTRVDVACQVCAQKKNAHVQTKTITDLRHSTQYEQQICVQTPDPEVLIKIEKFLESYFYTIEDAIRFNYYIHLYTNDYNEFLNPYVQHVYTNYKQIVACQDIKNCQGKQVSCVSWNPFISGLFVASYVHTSFDHVYTTEPTYEDKDTFEEHVALVWSFSNMQKPKLYLHSFREVTNISFCPYDENIIVGGCSNGQIVIWDIKGHLSKVENKEVLTPLQRNNQMHIEKLVLWMKKLPSDGHVNACVSSALQHGHKTAITNITWIPPEYYITSTGQFTKCDDNNTHMQFVTSSLEDNNVCVWDLNHYQNVKKQVRRKPLQRLNKLPPALHKDDSPLKKKHVFFIPIFMLLIKDAITQKPLHIRSMIFKDYEYNYQMVKSVQVENNFQRIYFNLSPLEVMLDLEQAFVINTVSGMIYDCSWNGFTYDHGNKINFDNCTLKPYLPIHDAPIKMCVANKDEPNIFLSIGGKVFAIWQIKQPTPILWRKCLSSYIFGKWSQVHPFEILLFTNDGFIQLWNFSVNSKVPTYIVRAHGMPPVGIYSNVGVEHYIRNAILMFDQFGAIRIHTAGNKLMTKSMHFFDAHESIKAYIETKKKVQDCVAYWCNRFKETQSAPDEKKHDIVQSTVIFETPVVKDGKNISMQEKFEAKQQIYMHEQLTEYKGIHLNQLELNKKILEEVIIQNNELSRKCAIALDNKANLFERRKRVITWASPNSQRKTFKITLPEANAKDLKKRFFEDYLLIEKQLYQQLEEFKFVERSLSNRMFTLKRNKYNHPENTLKYQAFKFDFRNTVAYKTVDYFDD